MSTDPTRTSHSPPRGASPTVPTTSMAFTEFIVKVHSRCNLACTYCYVYEMADQSWKAKPTRISDSIVRRSASRIGEHAAAHQLPAVRVVLHGGEPLLVGATHLAFIAEQLREQVKPPTTLLISLQTNGVLLTPGLLDVLSAQQIGVSVSIDGAAADHDRYRRYRDGRGSYQAVTAGIDQLRSSPYRHLYRGLLSTINLRNDPIRTYEALSAFHPPRMDFLLPHGNWSEPPPGRPDDATTPYADWLCTIFDRWYDSPEPQPEIRIFAEIIQLLLGGSSHGEMIGLSPATVVVVETDGTIEQVDALKSAYEGAPGTGYNVEHNDFDEVARHPAIRARQRGFDGLSDLCQQCRLSRVCGGGYYPHRYREATGFANPSVYCADLQALIDHVRSRVATDLSRLRGGT